MKESYDEDTSDVTAAPSHALTAVRLRAKR
jgi:hypothetical protein